MNYSRPLRAATAAGLAYDAAGAAADDIADPNQRDRTLRALEGRREDDDAALQMTPPDSAKNGVDSGEDTTDMFLRIAREDSAQRENAAPEEQSVVVSCFRFTPWCFSFFYFVPPLSMRLKGAPRLD
jgi:hypothetical protein